METLATKSPACLRVSHSPSAPAPCWERGTGKSKARALQLASLRGVFQSSGKVSLEMTGLNNVIGLKTN